MRRFVFSAICLLSLMVAGLAAQDCPKQLQSPRLVMVAQAVNAGNQNAVQAFWQVVEEHGAPLIEPIPGDTKHYWTTFLWRAKGPVKNVLLKSGLTNYSYGRNVLSGNLLCPLPGTDIWYRTYHVRSDARFTYEFSVDDSLVPEEEDPHPDEREDHFHPDPLNPRHAESLAADKQKPDPDSDSLAELPDAPAQDWYLQKKSSAKGELKSFPFKSHALNSERKIWVYTPALYVFGKDLPYRLLIMMDGELYTGHVPTPVILDNLLAAGKVVPTVAVFVGNLSANQPVARTTELSCYQPFTDFLVKELLPWVHEKYHVTSDPKETVLAGASRGGTAVACAALAHPELFGNVGTQSGFFVLQDRNWFKNARPDLAGDAESQEEMAWERYGLVMQMFANRPRADLRFYLDAGRYENTFHPSLLTANRHLRDVLTAKGYPVKYQEFSGHHSFVNWRGTLPDELMYLLGPPEPTAAAESQVWRIRPLDQKVGHSISFPEASTILCCARLLLAL